MKNFDIVSKRILSIGLAMTAVILSATLFMSTVGAASADNSALDNIELPDSFTTPPAGDEIMMDYTSVHTPSSDKTYYEVLVWNTSTGQSVLYYYNYTDEAFIAYEDNVQLPRNPLNY
ncbi:MAG: hypothetical protein QNK23_09430 [Crocinitomicaceae bacterium]|nr:hypothetical protein [Crocinitomicaceae bacterium]